MWFFSRVADWWDEKKKEASEYLHEFVDEHPHWWAIAIAGTVETSMRLGGGFVDVLRLGDGVTKEGGWRGVLHDGLRLLSIAGPIAKAGRGIARFVVPDAKGGVCAWVSATQALRQTGVQHFATMDDLIIATGKTPGAATMSEVEDMLRASGADVSRLPRPSNMLAVKELAAANPNGVVMFGIRWTRLVPKGGEIVEKAAEHALYAYRNILGKVKIIDRTGRSVEMLSELEPTATQPGYAGISQAWPTAATLVKNATGVTLINGASAIAVEVRAAMLASEKAANAAYERFKAMRDAGYDRKTAVRPDQYPAPAKKGVNRPKDSGPSNKPTPSPAPVRPSTGSGTPVAHVVHTVKPGETWASVLRPFYNPSSGIPFDEFVSIEKATNRLMGHAPESGELTPGLQIWIY